MSLTVRLTALIFILAAPLIGGCQPATPEPAGVVWAEPGVPASAEASAANVSTGSSPLGLSLPALPSLTYPSTPQEVFEQARAAANSHQWRTYLGFVNPEGIDAKFTTYTDSAINWDENQTLPTLDPRLAPLASQVNGLRDAIFAACKARGISREMLAQARLDPDYKAALLVRIGDRPAFVADVLGQNVGNANSFPAALVVDSWHLREDTALVNLSAKQGTDEIYLTIGLKKIGGQWKLDF